MMMRQSSNPEQQGGGMLHHPNDRNRLAMTAPRPRLHRLLPEDETSSTSSVENRNPEAIIRKNLFAPSHVINNDVFRPDPTAIIKPSYNHHYHQHQPQLQYIHQSASFNGNNRPTVDIQSLVRTPPKARRTAGRGTFSTTVKRTGNDHFCGLTAEISREIAFQTPMKTPGKSLGKAEEGNTGRRIIMNPASRDLFRAKSSVPMTDSKLMNLQLTKTASMSSSDGASSPAETDSNPVVMATPKTQTRKPKAKIRKTPFVGLSARKKVKRCLTPPRNTFGSHMKASKGMSTAAHQTLSTSYDGVNNFRMTSSEHDPAPFQVELPAKKEILVHSKICALMDGYTAIHRDFNFAMLSGIGHPTLAKEYERSTEEKPMIAGSCHRDVVKTLLDCADDLVVEGFFREYTEETDEKESERIEACILSSESLRQIIVCFRGSTANQAKPLVTKSNLFGTGTKQVPSMLHKEHQVPVLDAFRSVYFGTPLVKTVFALLSNLTTRKPFFDVVMTGHSFGAAMATLGALRYATHNSQMRVSCYAFGSPRIGGEKWRQLVHSVPNLRVYRVENGNDPYVMLPSGNEWVHCGHAIQISDDAEFKAHRFDRDQSTTTNNNLLGYVQSKVMIPKNLSQGSSSKDKTDHEIQSYVGKLTNSGGNWCADFCEVKGNGVNGSGNEKRTLA